jgi:hypothetical protein
LNPGPLSRRPDKYESFLKGSKLSRTKENKLFMGVMSNFKFLFKINNRLYKSEILDLSTFLVVLSGKNKKIGFYFSDKRSIWGMEIFNEKVRNLKENLISARD